ncbi:T9SS type A sorting domain-containing protein [Chryseobacterium vrystaatense]|uniref:Por secretion system C-terminal sorting domain-containing protein n=1 Tax=Chryseobacterium vrystaatense TaxID=307480 RepID=A0A1M5ICX9_9FLAO|nr:T9SS type A sorting domain-containing protein [Chryseobacterium vrystaatense]SHG26238.1 Por secretion system C-terminal sorting domain-containing protein [Chryseobacterium vrystaatense]
MHTIAHSVIQKIGLGFGLLFLGQVNAQQWEDVGGLQNVSVGGSSFNNLVIDNAGNYYLSYYDLSVSKGSVQKFNGNSWSYLGGSPGITTSYATFSSLSTNTSGTDVYYTNQGTGFEARHFNGTSWNQLPAITSSTTNYQASAVSPSNILFTYGSYGSGTVKRFVNGTWEQVGNTGFSNGAEFAEMVIGTNNMVYTSNVSGGLRVYQNNVTASASDAWSLVGGSIVDASSSGEQYSSDLAIDGNNHLYAAYVSSTASGKKINVKKFDGTAWTQIGNANFSDGKVQHLALAVTASGVPYVAASRWEDDNFLRNTVYKLDAATQNWIPFGGDFISDDEAKYNDLAVDNIHNYLVLAYSEDGTKVKRIPLPAGNPQLCNNTDPGNNPGDTGCVTFPYRGQSVTYSTVRGADGKIWLQQNLGSTQTASSFYDTDAYGDLFQWGRWDDGHQLRNSSLAGNAPSPNNPNGIGSGSGSFHSAAYQSSSNWWSDGQTTDQWSASSTSSLSDINGIDPCKAIGTSWKMPSKTEVEHMIETENISDITSGLDSNLKLVPAGIKDYSGIFSPGTRLYLWTSTPSAYTGSGEHLYISQFSSLMNSAGRDSGQSVRCIKGDPSLGTSDIKTVPSVGIYPNPTKGIVNIKADNLIDAVNVFNTAGQKLPMVFKNNQIDLFPLPSGVYILEIRMKNGKSITKKLIKN